jgi:hypothetical protein
MLHRRYESGVQGFYRYRPRQQLRTLAAQAVWEPMSLRVPMKSMSRRTFVATIPLIGSGLSSAVCAQGTAPAEQIGTLFQNVRIKRHVNRQHERFCSREHDRENL